MDNDPLQAQAELSPQGETPVLKVWLNRAGLALGIAGVIFVGFKLSGYRQDLTNVEFTVRGYAAIAALCVAYAGTNLLLTIGWQNLLSTNEQPVRLRWALTTYAVSGLAKYVPGNIFQFASRHALGLAAGFTNRALIKSTLLELACLIIAAATCALLLLPTLWPTMSLGFAMSLSFAAALCLAFAATLIGGVRLLISASSYFAFICISGLIFAAIFQSALSTSMDPSTVALVTAAYIVAWILGLIMPGAPAGIGVREAALIGLLGSIAAPSIVALAAILARLVTVSGDLLFFGFSQALARSERRQP